MPKHLPIFSGSSAGRVVACPASAALPRVESSGEAAETGRAIHAFIDRRIMGMGEGRALETVPEEHRERCRRIDLAGLTAGLSVCRPEVAFGLDLERLEARELGRLAVHRAYPVEENEVGLTVDLVAITEKSLPLVLDWKTGQEVDSVERNAQMMTAAAAVSLVHGVDEVEARIVYIREDGSHWVDACVYDGLTIDAWLESLKGAHAAVLAARAEMADGKAPSVVRPGKHCQYCPSLAACPAHVGLARSLAPELEEVGARVAALSPTEAGAVYAKARQFRAILSHVEAGLKAYAKAHPIPLEGGKEYRVATATRRSLDSDKLMALARRLGASEDDVASCFVEATYETVREGKRKVFRSPKGWQGENYEGRTFSETCPEFLEQLASSLWGLADWQDGKDKRDKHGNPSSAWTRKDASRARRWALRLREKSRTPAPKSNPASEFMPEMDDNDE